MSQLKLVNPPGTETIYERFKFSQAVVAGHFVEVAGQVGIGPDFKVPDDVARQAELAFTNLKNVLEAAGSGLEQVLHLTQYFTDIGDVAAVDTVFARFFPRDYPARTVVQVAALVLPTLKLEIQARAVLKDEVTY
jgi:reactive intermediate/imine deaminase